MVKRKTTLTIDPVLLHDAQKLGLNISNTLEIALIKILNDNNYHFWINCKCGWKAQGNMVIKKWKGVCGNCGFNIIEPFKKKDDVDRNVQK